MYVPFIDNNRNVLRVRILTSYCDVTFLANVGMNSHDNTVNNIHKSNFIMNTSWLGSDSAETIGQSSLTLFHHLVQLHYIITFIVLYVSACFTGRTRR